MVTTDVLIMNILCPGIAPITFSSSPAFSKSSVSSFVCRLQWSCERFARLGCCNAVNLCPTLPSPSRYSNWCNTDLENIHPSTVTLATLSFRDSTRSVWGRSVDATASVYRFPVSSSDHSLYKYPHPLTTMYSA